MSQRDALPSGWCWATLGEVLQSIEAGKSPRAVGRPAEAGEFGVLKVSAVSWGRFRSEENKFVPPENLPAVLMPVRTNDLLISRANTLELVGAVVLVRRDWPSLLLSDKTLRLVTASPDVRKDFLLQALRARSARGFVEVHATGTKDSMRNLSQEKIRRIPIAVAPSSEQRRIVEAIESYFTRLDDAVSTLERVQRNLKRYRASVLKAAVEGRLVPTEAELARAEGRDYEPASVLLERILVERRRRWEEAEVAKLIIQNRQPASDGWKRKYKPPAPPDEDSLPILPVGWCWATLDQLSHYTIDYRGKTPPTAPSGIPVISAANVKNGGLVFDRPRYVSEETYASHAVRGFSRPGDLIVTTEAPVGETAVYPSKGTYLLTRRVIGFQMAEVESEYVGHALSGSAAYAHLRANNRGTTVPRILKPALMATPIALPPAAEQKRIVAEVSRHQSVEGAAGAMLTSNTTRLARLRQAILKWAFEGKLADQDPNDEPASALLERIKAEKAATAASTKKSSGRGRRSKRPSA